MANEPTLGMNKSAALLQQIESGVGFDVLTSAEMATLMGALRMASETERWPEWESAPSTAVPEESSGERRLRHRIEKIDAVLDELGAPKSDGWDGLNVSLSQVGRILRLVGKRRGEDGSLIPVAPSAKGASKHPEDTCERCGGSNVVWFAPSELWNKAVRAVGAQEILCPCCFVKLAEAAGIKPTAWKVAPEELP